MNPEQPTVESFRKVITNIKKAQDSKVTHDTLESLKWDIDIHELDIYSSPKDISRVWELLKHDGALFDNVPLKIENKIFVMLGYGIAASVFTDYSMIMKTVVSAQKDDEEAIRASLESSVSEYLHKHDLPYESALKLIWWTYKHVLE